MAALSQAVADHFAEAGVRYLRPDDGPTFFAPFELHSGNATLLAVCEEDAQRLMIRVMLPFNAPAARRLAVAEFITRVNYKLILGCFEMDFSDGELSFRATIDVENDRLTPALVHNLVGCSLATTDRFYTALAAVALGGIAPADALAMQDKPAAAKTRPAPLFGSSGLAIDPRERLN